MFKTSTTLRFLLLVFTTLLLAFPSYGKDYGAVNARMVAKGVYLFTTTPYAEFGFSGNSIAILSDEGVIVFDSSALPETAATVLAEIRKLTDKPVRYLINSHWHWDHWGGNEVYLKAFPDLKIIAHEKTRHQMMEVEPRWNAEGLKSGLPAYLQQIEKRIAEAKGGKEPQDRIADLEERLRVGRNFLTQKTTLIKTFPNLTFSEEMTLHTGRGEIRVLQARAITPGDSYLFMPNEKILITGDILLNPYPYAIGGTYPSDWLDKLRQFQALDADIIIPGHGEPQEKEFLQKNIDLFSTILEKVRAAKKIGLNEEQAIESIGKDSAALAAILSITDKELVREFQAYFLSPFVVRAWKEMNGPLSDLPDGLL